MGVWEGPLPLQKKKLSEAQLRKEVVSKHLQCVTVQKKSTSATADSTATLALHCPKSVLPCNPALHIADPYHVRLTPKNPSSPPWRRQTIGWQPLCIKGCTMAPPLVIEGETRAHILD